MSHSPQPSRTGSQHGSAAREHLAQLRHDQARERSRSRRRKLLSIGGGVLLVALAVTLVVSTALGRSAGTKAAGSAQSGSSLVGQAAPDFVMPDTAGQEISLASFRGKQAVVLYFSEGAGCDACLSQMKAIEQKESDFSAAGFAVLPIVMDTRAQIASAASGYGVTTPFLIDTGTVSKAYGTLGKGMHAGMPGHGFVVVDKAGVVRWSGEYPSMWLDPSELLSTAKAAVH